MTLAFRIDGEAFAAPIAHLEEILPYLPIDQVPQSPSYLLGVVFVCGHIVPILDGAERIGVVRRGPPPDDPHILAFRLGGARGRLVGLLVDEALDLVDVPEAGFAAARELFLTDGPFRGVVDSGGVLYRMIDPERLLRPEEATALDRMSLPRTGGPARPA